VQDHPVRGPLVLGVVGAALVFLAVLVNLIVVRADNPRYKLNLLDTFNGGAEVKRLVRDMGRINILIVFGAAIQLAAVVWQAAAK
jgi:hypothetical protein